MPVDDDYYRDCKFCGKSVKMHKDVQTHKWGAYDVSGDKHQCQKGAWKGPQKTTSYKTGVESDKAKDYKGNAKIEQIIDDIDRMHKILNNLQDRLEEELS